MNSNSPQNCLAWQGTLRGRMSYKLLIAMMASAIFCVFMAANTNAIGSASVKDFGAVGDSITDDSDAIIQAFNSDYDTIVLPEGDYRITRQIQFTRGDKTIIGEKATLFSDDNYTKPADQYADQAFITVRSINNITFKGLHFDARKGSSPVAPFSHLVFVIYATGIHFDSCTFTSDPGLTESTVIPVDFFAGWHDVSVLNSQFIMLHNKYFYAGGSVMFRSYWNTDSSDAVFSNNTIYKFCGDELLWIAVDQAVGSISNIEVSGNRFYFGDSTNNVYSIATSAYAPDQIKNINFHNNEVIGNGSARAIELEAVENFEIYDNDIYTKVPRLDTVDINGTPTIVYTGGIFGSRNANADSPITTDTVKIHNNRTITLDSEFMVAGVTFGAQPYHVFDNDRIIINAPAAENLIRHKGSFTNNTVVLNGNARNIVGPEAKNLQDNNILINGYANYFLQNYNSDLTAPATYTGNTIITTEKRPNPDQTASSVTRLVMMNNFAMNNYPITISGNIFINGAEIEDDSSIENFTVPNMGSNTVTDRTATATYYNRLWEISSLEDAVPADQAVNICDNTVKGFRVIPGLWHSATISLTCGQP